MVRASRYEKLALAFASGATAEAAAKAAGVSTRTAERRRADPEFKRRVSALRVEMRSDAAGLIASRMAVAARKLASLAYTAKSESVQLQAARALLELGVTTGNEEMEQRLADVERRLAASESPKAKLHGGCRTSA